MAHGSFVLKLSPENPNRRDVIEPHHALNGAWEQKHGPQHTRRLAASFHRAIAVPLDVHSVLDLGCSLGDALPVWKARYPEIRLFGCDVTDNAVRRCQERFGHIATIFKSGFEDLAGHYDAIYCSHVLEHFEQHVEIAAHLLQYCRILYVLVPFNELRDNRPLRPSDGDWHVASLYSDSFDELVRSRAAESIETKVIPFPRVWWRRAAGLMLRAARSALTGKPQIQEQLQIVFTIRRSSALERNAALRPE